MGLRGTNLAEFIFMSDYYYRPLFRMEHGDLNLFRCTFCKSDYLAAIRYCEVESRTFCCIDRHVYIDSTNYSISTGIT